MGVQHLVDLPQARVGSMPALLAPCERQQNENTKQEEDGKGWG